MIVDHKVRSLRVVIHHSAGLETTGLKLGLGGSENSGEMHQAVSGREKA